MSFATDILQPSSRRFSLVRIEPRRRLYDAVDLGGDDYQYALDSSINVIGVKVNGGSCSFTRSGDSLTVTSPSFNPTLGGVFVILTHALYLTGEKAVVTSGISGVPDATWLPYLSAYPTVTQSMKNIGEGIFTISSSTVDIITTDRFIQPFFGADDSFQGAEVTCWSCIGTADINRVSFYGNVTSASLSNSVASLAVADRFLKLLDTGSFGTYAESYVYSGSTLAEYPDIETDEAAKMVMGYSSPVSLKQNASPAIIGTNTGGAYHVTGGLKLIKDSPSIIGPTTANASYFVSRFVGTALKKLTFGTVTRCYKEVVSGASINSTVPYVEYYFVQCSNFYGEVGDCLPNGLPGVSALPMWICNNRNIVGPDAATYQFVCVRPISLWVSMTPPSSGIQANPTPVDNSYSSYCVYRNGLSQISYDTSGGAGSTSSKDVFYYLNQFNATVTPRVVSLGTYGGESVSALYIDIDYSNAALGAFFRFADLSPSNFYCRFSPSTQLSHAEAMLFIVENSGLSANLASFTQADIDLDADVSWTVPGNSQTTFSTYLSYAQTLAKSTLGLLNSNVDGDIEYKILESPELLVADIERDNSNVLLQSVSASIDYQDIFSELVFQNEQLIDQDALSGTGPAATVESDIAKYLHTVSKSKKYSHCLKSMVNRSESISNYVGQSSVEYTYTTSSLDLDTSIGDIAEFSNASVLNESGTVNTVVLEVSSSPGNTKIRLTEARGGI